MPERDGYIPGVPCWADVSVPDPEAAAEFYGGLFGWEFDDRSPPGSGAKYLNARARAASTSIFDTSGEVRSGDVAAIRSIPEGAPPAAMWNTYIWVDSADDTASKVVEAGGKVIIDPYEAGPAGRMAMFADPEGATFWAQQADQHRGAQLVNDPGAVVFNNLNTRDAEAAKSFYGSVFGWRTGSIGGGAEGWTLSGYGDWLEREHHPGLREQMRDAGAPEGFEDVIGSIVPLGDDQPDTPPHWGITFATDDTDATAAKVEELGGKVIVPPFDAPWSTATYTIRITLAADPQGATFTASRFLPKTT
jgi:uncharacterized protein